jgi:hypothetical protein
MLPQMAVGGTGAFGVIKLLLSIEGRGFHQPSRIGTTPQYRTSSSTKRHKPWWLNAVTIKLTGPPHRSGRRALLRPRPRVLLGLPPKTDAIELGIENDEMVETVTAILPGAWIHEGSPSSFRDRRHNVLVAGPCSRVCPDSDVSRDGLCSLLESDPPKSPQATLG